VADIRRTLGDDSRQPRFIKTVHKSAIGSSGRSRPWRPSHRRRPRWPSPRPWLPRPHRLRLRRPYRRFLRPPRLSAAGPAAGSSPFWV
jgi:hypothetical protein